MFDEIAGAYGSRFLLAAGGVGVALLCLVALLWLMRRRRGPSPFVRGGKNRQPRLQVLDAAAVDARRRLVLVRRDDVEHLIMIGGPTDIVIESRISDGSKETAVPAASFEVATSAPVAAERPSSGETRPAPVIVEAQPEPRRPATPQPAPLEPMEEVYAPLPAAVAAQRHQVAAVEPPARTVPPVAAERVAQARPTPTLEVAMGARREPAAERPAPQRVEPQVATPPAQSIPTVASGTPVSVADAAVRPVSPPLTAASVDASSANQSAQTHQRELGGDFQSILEEEMSNNLRAERIIPNAPQPGAQRQVQQPPAAGERREPELDPPAASDNALQSEVARIFGEMSVNRDK
jgi:hypothetical protein